MTEQELEKMLEGEKSKTIYQRLVKARRWVKNPPLDCTNPHFRNRYASLSATLDEVNKACSMECIAYFQVLTEKDGAYMLRSFVMDEAGSRFDLSEFPVSNSGDPQKFGSEMTYKKRQQAQADWGIVGEEDDDGEAASKPVREAAAVKQAHKPAQTKDPRLDAVRGLYKQATAAGVKQEGIESWLVANMGHSLKDLDKLDDKGLQVFESYLRGRIDDLAALKGAA